LEFGFRLGITNRFPFPHSRLTFSRANLSVHLHSKTCLVFSNVAIRLSKNQTRFQISNLRFEIQAIDEASKLQPSKRDRHEMFHSHIWLPRLRAQLSTRANRQFANRQCHGGGEGIRTPDPRVANAVLCQLSYAPEKRIRISRFQIPEIGCGGGI
jgi:hypothetical protein